MKEEGGRRNDIRDDDKEEEEDGNSDDFQILQPIAGKRASFGICMEIFFDV